MCWALLFIFSSLDSLLMSSFFADINSEIVRFITCSCTAMEATSEICRLLLIPSFFFFLRESNTRCLSSFDNSDQFGYYPVKTDPSDMSTPLLGACIPPFFLMLLSGLLPPPPRIYGVPDDEAETLRVRWYSGSSETVAVR